jgi:hypothetical protein
MYIHSYIHTKNWLTVKAATHIFAFVYLKLTAKNDTGSERGKHEATCCAQNLIK